MIRALALAGVVLSTAACGGGGGGGASSFDRDGVLLSIRFPDPGQQNAGSADQAPDNASLVQQVTFEFSGRPDPALISRVTLPIRDVLGTPVEGVYQVSGRVVTFTPQLPTHPPAPWEEGTLPETYDNGGAGLLPDSHYRLEVDAAGWSFLSGIAAPLQVRYGDPTNPDRILLTFRTTSDPALFFTGLPKVGPRLVAVDPQDGAVQITPELYTDPEGRFAPRRPFRLTFDAPLRPDDTNVGDATFVLVDLDHRSGTHPAGLSLGVHVRILHNTLDEAIVEVEPSGILPFGHTLALEYPATLRGLSQDGDPGARSSVASVFRIAPAPDETLVDVLREPFEDDGRRNSSPGEAAEGFPPADWDRGDSNVLQAAFSFEGTGLLGRFLPPPPPVGETRTVVLDTDSQGFPLPDGSTPDAPVTTVSGGRFYFSEIDVPHGVILEIRGSQPLRLSATESARFDGVLDQSGSNGNSEAGFDSANSSVPGGAPGAGGGRGGVGHPIEFWPPDVFSSLSMISPARGGNGDGPLLARAGGEGGLSGIGDLEDDDGKYTTDKEINCVETGDENRNGKRVSRPPGAGGGSFLAKGKRGKDGFGNVRPDGQGGWVIEDRSLEAGGRGPSPFSDRDSDNDFIGPAGEIQEILGGQGGGGGGSCSEGYYCGGWCRNDGDPANDGVCDGPEYAGLSDSVSDSRGGGGGGGGGALLIQCLGPIWIGPNARIAARGGGGGGGEALGSSNWSGSGGGGSGGALIFQAAGDLVVEAGASVDVSAGSGAPACFCDGHILGGCSGCSQRKDNPGAGGDGGHGIIQFQLRGGQVADVRGTVTPPEAWVDQGNERNTIGFDSVSVAVSGWFDLGRTVARPPPGVPPLFQFAGLDVDGYVETDADGMVIDPSFIECDYLGQRNDDDRGWRDGEEPREDFIPPNAIIRVEFQAAHPIAEGSKEVDPQSLTDWLPGVETFRGLQFVRYRIQFDITADGSALTVRTRRPAVNRIRIRAEF